jgi:hypothetical protein
MTTTALIGTTKGLFVLTGERGGTFAAVLRDAFTTDAGDPAGLWFGTRSGEVYASFDEGDHWELVASHLPPVLSVRAAAG